jgi:hypothetical protein
MYSSKEGVEIKVRRPHKPGFTFNYITIFTTAMPTEQMLDLLWFAVSKSKAT